MENEHKNLKPLSRQKTRILRPWECRALISAIPKNDYKTMFKMLLFSGMRYVEGQRFQDHPEWFDGIFIHLPILAMKKKKRKQRERTVHLSAAGKEVMYAFTNMKRPIPGYTSWIEDLERWAGLADISTVELGPKTTRKTYESWLVTYFPIWTLQIAMSQGHTTDTALRHYLNLGFIERDREEMKDFVEGWI